MSFCKRLRALGTRRYAIRPGVEELRARIVPAPFTWTGQGGTVQAPVNGTFWDDASWNPPGRMPGANDAAYIKGATVGMDDPSGATVGSIQVSENVMLNVNAPNEVNGFVYQGSSDDGVSASNRVSIGEATLRVDGSYQVAQQGVLIDAGLLTQPSGWLTVTDYGQAVINGGGYNGSSIECWASSNLTLNAAIITADQVNIRDNASLTVFQLAGTTSVVTGDVNVGIAGGNTSERFDVSSASAAQLDVGGNISFTESSTVKVPAQPALRRPGKPVSRMKPFKRSGRRCNCSNSSQT